ncbi:MAG: glycosyltransferase family 2 protein [Bdellovibrionales bacterium]|nr:glycosyltransferase family 2 protein [Bdellovibrionales bacterium]
MTRSLSILITYHNEKELLTECLRSLMGQLDPCDEILIYDDASEFPPQKYIPRGMFARVFREEKNRGPAFGRNLLLSKARGEYIHFHDSDDWFADSWARRIRRLLIASPCDAIFTEVNSYRNGKQEGRDVVGIKAIDSPEKLLPFCINHFMLVPTGTYRREVVEKIGGYREALWQSEDFDFHVRLANSGIKFELILEPLVSIRLRAESRSQNREEVLSDAVNSLRFLADEIPSQYHLTLAQKASKLGSDLFQHGFRRKAREAFRLAKRLGPATFEHRPPFYQKIASRWGQELAEWVALLYRVMIPEGLRKSAQKPHLPSAETRVG